MKIYFPLYYKNFKCIAEKCHHSCCVGWDISVDDVTLKKYEAMLDTSDILSNIRDGEICMRDDGRCPFLRDDGLCRLICEFGEDYTSEICQRHPRFYHRVGDRVECGIGASCEEACRLILSLNDFSKFFLLDDDCIPANETDFDSLSYRDDIFSLLCDESLNYREKTNIIKEKYRIPFDKNVTESLNRALKDIEFLEESHRDLFSLGANDYNYDNHVYYLRFLAYLIFRHVSIATSHDNLRARLGFCLMLCSLLESVVARNGGSYSEIVDFARIISEEIEYSEDNTASLIFEFECIV